MAVTKNSRSLQITDPVLTRIARQYRPNGFVYDQLAPSVPIANEAFQYITFGRDWFNAVDPTNLKADRTESKEIDLEYSLVSGLAQEYALKVSISDRERANAAPGLQLERSKQALLSDRMAIAREVRLAALLRKTDVTGGGLNLGATPSVNWDQDTAVIETDITIAKEAVYDATGYVPNTIVIPWKVANAIAKQEDIREILKYTVNGQEILRQGELILPRALWGLRVLIARGQKATNAEGATVATSEVWGTHVRVLYVDPNAQYGIPSVAYSFVNKPITVTRWRETDPDVEYVREHEIVSELVTAPDMGYEIREVL